MRPKDLHAATPAPARRATLERTIRPLRGPDLALAIPLALAMAACWRVLPGGFVYDDLTSIAENAAVKDLGRYLEGGAWRDLTTGQRPLVTLTFALNYAYGGLEPWNYHLTNLLLHLLATALAWAAGRSILRLAAADRADALAVVAAGLFALHPLQAQAVSYVTQRAEVLASAFALAGLLGLLAAERRGLGWRAAPAWLGAGASLVAGFATKATVVTLPVAWLMLMLLVPSPAARTSLRSWRVRLLAAVPLLLLSAWLASLSTAALVGAQQGFGIPGLPPWRYLAAQAGVVATYLRLLAWPAGQCVDWNLAPPDSLLSAGVLVPGLLLLALLAGALRLAWRARHDPGPDGAAARVAGAGVLWFFLLLAPTSTLVPLADLLMEHRVYLPALGPFLAVVVAVERALARWSAGRAGRLGAALALAAWAACALALHQRNAVWEGARPLWSDAVAKHPANPRAWNNLATAVMDEGRWAEATELLRRGLLQASGEPAMMTRLHANLGGALTKLGRHQEAEQVLAQAAALYPWDAILVENRVALLVILGRLEEAEAVARQLLGPHGQRPEGLAALGRVRLARGDAAGALRLLDQAIALEPDRSPPYLLRAQAMAALGRRVEACGHLMLMAIRLDPAIEEELQAAGRELRCGPLRSGRPGR